MSASIAQLEIGFLRPPPTRAELLQMRFEIFNESHPKVLQELVRLARERLAARARKGRSLRIGAKALVEALRWHEDDDDAPSLPFIDNSFTSRFARLMSRTYPDLADVFETRELDS